MIRLKRDVGEKWERIEAEGGDFEVKVRPSTHSGLMEAYMADTPGQVLLERIKDRVIDWRGVEDDAGKPVRFSIEKLGELIEAAPGVLQTLTKLVFASGDEPKNSPLPPEDGSPPETAETTSESSPSSDSSTG